MNRGPLLSLSGEYFNISWHLGYVISRWSYLVKAAARGAQRTAPWPPSGPRASFEKPWPIPYQNQQTTASKQTKNEKQIHVQQTSINKKSSMFGLRCLKLFWSRFGCLNGIEYLSFTDYLVLWLSISRKRWYFWTYVRTVSLLLNLQ